MGKGRKDAILVVSPRRRTRALLAGEVGERVDRDVIPAAGVDEALQLIKLLGVDPAVVVLDADQGVSVVDGERLLDATPGVPVVLVVRGLRREAFGDVGERCAMTLVRPVPVGDVARAVVGLLEG